VRTGENISIFISLIVYSCFPDLLFCHADNLRHSGILLADGNWSPTEVPLVFATKCHPTSALLASGVLSCTSAEVFRGVCWRNLRERDHLVDPDLDVKTIIW
jgi:hypothetical protein